MMGDVYLPVRSVEPLFVWMPQVARRLCAELFEASLE
jgi:hypothetical protein